jgi:hypothetical protein
VATKDYAAIARQRISKPSQSQRAPRALVYGRNKKGKTRFCASCPNILILDPEEGTDHETRIDPDTWKINRWEDINDAYMFLKSGKAVSPHTNHPYTAVALDGLTRIQNMALRWVMSQEEERNLDRKPNQVGKQDYGRANEMVKGVLHNFHSLRDMTILITAQERMREVEASEEDEDATNPSVVFVPDLPNGTRSAVNSIVDVIGRIYTIRGDFKKRVRDARTKEVKTIEYHIQRRLWIGHHESYDTGARSEYPDLPDYITEPTAPKLIKLMREGAIK